MHDAQTVASFNSKARPSHRAEELAATGLSPNTGVVGS
jgi:hypothetical protein